MVAKKCFKTIIEKYHLKEEIHPTKEKKGLKDKDNPMEPINAIHRRLKAFMKSHGSYDRKDIQKWMNLVYFILVNKDDEEALLTIRKLLKRIISTSKKTPF